MNNNYDYLIKLRVQSLSSKGKAGKQEAEVVQAELESKKKVIEREAANQGSN